jgi:hypothetical protein
MQLLQFLFIRPITFLFRVSFSIACRLSFYSRFITYDHFRSRFRFVNKIVLHEPLLYSVANIANANS